MSFFTDAINTIQVIVVAIGAAIMLVGVISWLEGYNTENPASKSAGLKSFMSGAGIALIGLTLVPKLAELFTIG